MFRDTLKRMDTELQDVVQYTLDINGVRHNMNDYIGKQIKIEWGNPTSLFRGPYDEGRCPFTQFLLPNLPSFYCLIYPL